MNGGKAPCLNRGQVECARHFWQFPRRGGNRNNTSNAGLGYCNSNNDRGNSNVNYGVRSGFPTTKALRVTRREAR